MFNTMIRAQASSSNPFEAIILYIKMRKLGLIPGKYTFPFVLKACINCCSLNPSIQIHADVVKFGLKLDMYIVNGLIRCYYCIYGDMGAARKLFEEVPERKLLIWTAIISGYAQNFCSNEALALFDQMLGQGVEPDAATLSSVLSACARSGSLEMGKQVHVYIKEKGIEVGLILGTALVDMYAKNGEISVARSLFDKMLERNTASWNAMICGLAVHGHAEEAFQLFQEMQKEKIAPNNVTFVGVLSACFHAGLLEVGKEIFLSMKRVYGIEPGIEHYGCMVNLLSRGGKLAEAEELIYGMLCEPDIVILGALLGACKDHGNIKVAEKVVKKMLNIEPQNHGVYIVLSNMYADAGSWADVLRLREEMKDGGVKKIPGWSLVNGNK